MGQVVKIERSYHTFNPWRGCEHATFPANQGGGVHPACEHCYAEAMSRRNPKVLGTWGNEASGGRRVVAAEKYWREPERWNREAAAAEKHRPVVFCASLADVFEGWRGPLVFPGKLHDSDVGKSFRPSTGPDDLATLDDVRRRLFEVIDATPNLDWMLLTKRPENVRRMWPARRAAAATVGVGWKDRPPHHRQNVWLGTSISDQSTAERWIPPLLECRDLAPVLWLSIEPLLGPVDLKAIRQANGKPAIDALAREGRCEQDRGDQDRGDQDRAPLGPDCARIDWVVVGGESGPGARPMNPNWARGLRDQCQSAGVPFFMKQWGEWVALDQSPECATLVDRGRGPASCRPDDSAEPNSAEPRSDAAAVVYRFGRNRSGRLLDGVEWSEFPSVSG